MPSGAHHRDLRQRGRGGRHAPRPSSRGARTGAGLLGSGTHPAAVEGEAEITDKTRYERIHELLGDAVATPVAGLHIHVGMPDAETAIRVFNGVRRHLPLLQALGANSPYRHGRDTGWPRLGRSRSAAGHDRGSPARCVTTPTSASSPSCWDRPLMYPTTRGSGGSCDPTHASARSSSERSTRRASVDDTVALVALVHCLARDAVEARRRARSSSRGARGGSLSSGAFRCGRAAS